MVIINAPGAGGTIGSRRVMNEKPDGYTVLFLHDGILTAKHSGKVLYGPSAFEQVAGTGRSGMVIAVHEDSPYNSLPALLDAAAGTSDNVTFAANLGAPSHFCGLIIEQEHTSAKFRSLRVVAGRIDLPRSRENMLRRLRSRWRNTCVSSRTASKRWLTWDRNGIKKFLISRLLLNRASMSNRV